MFIRVNPWRMKLLMSARNPEFAYLVDFSELPFPELCGVIGAGIGGGANCCFTASEILSAFASNRLTCHI